jgi:tetratricopeptide (TPR) repeat protein
MSERPSLFARLKQARIVQVLVVYLGATWVVLQLVDTLMGLLSLPSWVGPVAVVLLGVGLVVVLATAWVQSLPSTDEAEAAGERPSDWEVAPADALASLRAGRLPYLTWGRAMTGGVVALSLLFGVAGLFVLVRGGESLLGPTAIGAESTSAAVAVLPFQVRGDGLDVYGEGMVDLLTTNLEGLGGLRTINAGSVVARWRSELGETTTAELEAALRVAGGLAARYAIRGSAVNAGGQIRLAAEVFDLADGSRVDGAQVEGGLDGMLGLVDALTVQLAALFVGEGGSDFRGRALDTESLDALEAYLRGEALYRQLRLEDAAGAFREAAVADERFALAWWRLSEVWGWLAPGAQEGLQALERAQGMSEALPERERILLRVRAGLTEGDKSGIAALRSHLARHPEDAEAWNMLGEGAAHLPWMSRADEGEMELAFARAVELRPSFSPYYIHLIGLLLAEGREEEFRAYLDQAATVNPEDEYLEYWPYAWDFYWGSPGEMQAAEAYFFTQPMARRNVVALGMLQSDAAIRSRAAMGLFTTEAQEGFPFLTAAVEYSAGIGPALWDLPATSRAGGLVGWSLLTGEWESSRAELAENLGDGARTAEAIAAAVVAAWTGDTALLDQALDALPDTAWSGTYGDFGGAASPGQVIATAEAVQRLRSGDYAEAIELLNRITAEPRYDALAVFLLGEAYAGAGNWDAALEQYEVLLRGTFRPHVLLAMGRAFEENGETSSALERYQSFLTMWAEADPTLAPAVEASQAVARLGG